MFDLVESLGKTLIAVQNNPLALVGLIAVAALAVVGFALYVILRIGKR